MEKKRIAAVLIGLLTAFSAASCSKIDDKTVAPSPLPSAADSQNKSEAPEASGEVSNAPSPSPTYDVLTQDHDMAEFTPNAETHKELNAFLSVFMEEGLVYFNNIYRVDSEVFAFAIRRTYKENPGAFSDESEPPEGYPNLTLRVLSKDIDETMKKYFNISDYSHQDVSPTYFYDGEAYYLAEPEAMEEKQFAFAENFWANAEGTEIACEVFGYSVLEDTLSDGDDIYAVDFFKKNFEKVIINTGGNAGIKIVEENNQKRFILTNWDIIHMSS